MFGARDVGWALFVCFALTFMLQCRPSWEAQRFVERESQLGFLEAYAGHRFINGQLISPEGATGTQADPMAVQVLSRHFEITAKRFSFSGKTAEFVAHHAIQLLDGSPQGRDASQDVHLTLRKEHGEWVYNLFEIRAHGAIDDPNAGNPWKRAIRETTPKELLGP